VTHQRHLYDDITATVRGGRPSLYDGVPDRSELACQVCGSYLIRTEGGYLCCPRGHGRLITEAFDGDSYFGEDQSS
jgi:hypothetical protein